VARWSDQRGRVIAVVAAVALAVTTAQVLQPSDVGSPARYASECPNPRHHHPPVPPSRIRTLSPLGCPYLPARS
jgi:hypothetical protein